MLLGMLCPPLVLLRWEVMGAKHDKMEKNQGNGQTEGKNLQH